MPPRMTRAFTRATLRTTEGRPTARANSPLQVSLVHAGMRVHICHSLECNLGLCFHLEATSITEAPEDSEVKVGDEVILKCSASYDPMLDIVFVWSIDFRVIDFDTEWQHYERIMVG